MDQLILIAHLLIALGIIGLIMLQQGKGADMGASFGAGASQTLLGADGSGNILTKATAFLVVAFFATSFGLALLAKNTAQAVDDGGFGIPVVEQEAPVQVFDVPAVEEDLPALVDDLPALEDDLSVLEEDLPNLADDLPESITTGEDIPGVE